MIFPQATSRHNQQDRPPFFPPLRPSQSISTGTEQSPYRVTFLPPGSLPHFLNSQQFNLVFIKKHLVQILT